MINLPFRESNNKINKLRSNIVIVFFILLLTIGIVSVKDYGVSSDEYQNRLSGFTTLNYLGEKFVPNINKKFRGDKQFTKFSEWQWAFYGGTVYDAPIAFLETIIGIQDKKNQFLFKHYFNFIIYFLSLISFFKLAQTRFKNWKISLLGVLFLFLSPRIFANSFYNPKDLIFMCFIIFSMDSGMRFFKNPNFVNSFLFSFFSALAINIRIMGIIIPFLVFIIIFIYLILKKENVKIYFFQMLSSIFFMLFFIILFWPYLWDDPIKNIILSFTEFSNWYHITFNLYFGELVKDLEVPWHYIPVWIFITTPIFYLVTFFIGIVGYISLIIFDLKKRNIEEMLQDFFFLMIITFSLIAIISLNSTLYNGWRHMYFIYPSIIMVSLLGINFILRIIKKKYIYVIFQLLIIFSLSNTAYWMVKNHPNQNVYFNNLVREYANKNFELDYWGLSYKENFEYLLKHEKKEKFYIWNSSNTKMFYSLFSLNYKDRSKFVEVKNKDNANYWITNYYLDKHNYDSDFYQKYEIINEVKVDKISVNSLFKKK